MWDPLFICPYFRFYEQLKFCAQLSIAWKKFYNLGADYFEDNHVTNIGKAGFFTTWPI